MSPGQPQDWVCLYGLGLLDDDERRLFERTLAASDALKAELAEWEEVTARIGLAAVEAEPRAELRSKLLTEVHRQKMASRPMLKEEVSGVFVLRQGQGDWRPTPYPGVAAKLLYLDKIAGMATSLLKLDPGALYPCHHHTAEEQCYVIEGDIRLGDALHLHEGDFTTAVPGSNHAYLTSDGGCTVIIVSSVHDEVYG